MQRTSDEQLGSCNGVEFGSVKRMGITGIWGVRFYLLSTGAFWKNFGTLEQFKAGVLHKCQDELCRFAVFWCSARRSHVT